MFPPVISPWFLIKGRWKRFRGGPQIFGFTEEQKGKVGYVKGLGVDYWGLKARKTTFDSTVMIIHYTSKKCRCIV